VGSGGRWKVKPRSVQAKDLRSFLLNGPWFDLNGPAKRLTRAVVTDGFRG
jgi:hypothetical protein